MCWGYNSNGQLGNGSSGSDNATPGNVLNLSNARSISAGLDQYGNYTCAVLDNGSARCWGKNHRGQLGNGSSGTDNATPGVVIGLESVKSISTGGYHACAVLDNGSAMCWGYNDYGQLGNASSGTDNATPGAVAGLQSVKSISAGGTHTCAVLDNGSARCWGYNGLGQLGDGTTTQRNSPVAVSGLGSVKTISAGKNYTCAVLDNSSARCWGSNSNGQLGDGTTTTRTVPFAVSGLGSVNSISAGGTHTCALLNDKTAKCWGSNLNGQLGNGSLGTDNATPDNVLNLSNVRLP